MLEAFQSDPLAPHRAALAGVVSPATRQFYAAAHVVMLPDYAKVDHQPDRPCPPRELEPFIDWEATASLRRQLAEHGLGVAEAMDTAQRFEIGWDLARRLIEAAGSLGLEPGFIAGAGADHLPGEKDPAALIEGVVYQARVIQAAGGVPILLPLVQLAQAGPGPVVSTSKADYARRDGSADAYVAHYAGVIDALDGPLLIHWLGEMFHPGLAGYFPGDSFERIMAHDPGKVRGCKLSLLDADLERRIRDRIAPDGQVVFTGDDHHFVDLILEGGAEPTGQADLGGRQLHLGPFSHALLGVLEGVAEPAGLALRALAAGDHARARALLEPCEAYGRHVFSAPTSHYKAGLAFTSYLAGRQENPMLPLHLERSRDRAHLIQTAELAALAGAFSDLDLAQSRLQNFLSQ